MNFFSRAQKTEKTGDKPKLSAPSIGVIEMGMVLVSLLAVIGVLFMGWMALQPSAYAEEVQALVEKPAPTPLPSLKLNQEHVRRGAEIEVRPEEIGKENPFR
ncbi:MAG: hypothetical protein K0S20_691 [Patescibacteria group bacterium]|jgi:hypothetical protein|nr:hypothetical protein [Patescibacteria group bacterium]